MSHSPESPDKPDISTDAASESNGFLSRWSARKQAEQLPVEVPVQQAEPTTTRGTEAMPFDDSAFAASVVQPPVAVDPPAIPEAGEKAREEVPQETLLTDADMVPLETLTADSDYAPFMSSGVSNELRQLALKKLFFSGLFASRDGLDDYDDDFTRFEPLGDTITSDMKFQTRRREKQAQLEAQRVAEQEQLENIEDESDAQTESTEETEETAAAEQPSASQPVENAQSDGNAEDATDSEAENHSSLGDGTSIESAELTDDLNRSVVTTNDHNKQPLAAGESAVAGQTGKSRV